MLTGLHPDAQIKGLLKACHLEVPKPCKVLGAFIASNGPCSHEKPQWDPLVAFGCSHRLGAIGSTGSFGFGGAVRMVVIESMNR